MWPDDDGSWSPGDWQADGAINNGPQVVANDVLTQTTTSQGSDSWSGWLQGIVGDVAKYAVAKDAAKSGLTPGRTPTGQPIYTAMPGGSGFAANQNTMLLIGGAVLLVLVVSSLAHSKG